MLKNFNYKVKKSEDCVLININNWVQYSPLEIQKMNGKTSISYITEVLDINYYTESFSSKPIQKGDTVLISRVSAEVASMRGYDLGDGQKYYNIPITQVMGVFKEHKVNFESLEMIFNKVLIEKLESSQSEVLLSPSSNDMIGKVLKIGTTGFTKDWKLKPLQVKLGDTIIVKDNVTTEVRLNGRTYYAIDENNIVGIIRYGFSANAIKFINESILMKPYYSPTVLNSKILISPNINYEDLDYSDIYNRDLFQIEYLDSSIEGLSKKDKVIAKRDFTSYVYLNQEKYFLLNGKEWIESKIIE